ncbi:MAG: alpha-amylase, partial [Elusimicrobia bacterium]|nr:alpha-amylase [Elusimicrobiota bacterium]
AGITSTSRMGILAATNELYAAVIDGDKGRVVVKIGRNWGWNPGSGWTLATSGDRYAVWTQPLPK